MVIMSDQNKRVFFPNMAWSDIHWSETLKCSCLRNGVVCGFFFNAFTSSIFVFLNVNVLVADSKREWTATQAAVLWWWWWLLNRVKRAFVLCECQFWLSGNTNTLFDDAQRNEGTRQKYNSWSPDPDPFPSCLPSRHSYFQHRLPCVM